MNTSKIKDSFILCLLWLCIAPIVAPTMANAKQTETTYKSIPTDISGADGWISELNMRSVLVIDEPSTAEISVIGNDMDISDEDTIPSPTDHTDFGISATTSGLVTHTFTISNAGTTDLILSGMPKVVISGTHAADFTVIAQPASPVVANETTTFVIGFDPSADGLRSATVSIDNDDSDENPFNFGIQGTGFIPQTVYVSPSFTGTVGSAIIDADLGSAGNQPATQDVNAFATINNALTAVVTDGTIIVNAGNFSETVNLSDMQTLEISGADAAQAVTIADLTTGAGVTLTVEGSSTLTFGDADNRTLAGIITGSGNLIKQGSGIVTFSNKNTYSGSTLVSEGTLRVTINDGLGTVAGSTTIATGATLDLHNVNYSTAEPITIQGGALGNYGNSSTTFAGPIIMTAGSNFDTASSTLILTGAITGNFNLNKRNAGSLILSNIGNSFNRFTIAGGTLQLGAAGVITDVADLSNNSTFNLNGFDETIDAIMGNGSVYNLQTTPATLTIGGANSTGDSRFNGGVNGLVNIVKIGTGRQIFGSGGSSYTGTTTINNGTLAVSSESGGAAAQALGSAQGNTIVNAGGILEFKSVVYGLTEPIIMHGGMIRATGTSSFPGPVTLATSSATFDIASNTQFTLSNSISGDQNLIKSGNGVLILGASNTYSSATIINAGTLLVNGSIAAESNMTVNNSATLGGSGTIAGPVMVASGAKVSPGNSPAILNTGSIIFSNASTFIVEINGVTPGIEHDQLNVTGSVTLVNATLSLTGTYIPSMGASIVLINNDGTDAVSGTFAGLGEGASLTFNGVSLRITYMGGDGNDIVLSNHNLCFTSLDGTNTDFSSADSQAVRDAVAAAASGSTVHVAGYCAGVAGNGVLTQVVSIAKPLTLIGGYQAIPGTGIVTWSVRDFASYSTTLDALGSGRVIYATEPLTVNSFVVQQGFVAVSDSVCPDAGCGGGIFADQPLTLINTEVLSNTGGNGAGVYVNNTLTMNNSRFANNSASADGGGLRVAGYANVAESSFENNRADTAGGALLDAGGVLTNVTFSSNSAGVTGSGGGAVIGGVATTSNVTFTHNSAGSGGGGGAVFSDAILTGGAFISNSANFAGGGAYFNGAATILGTTFVSNTATSNRGGGAYFNGAALLSNTLFEGNRVTADRGGGAYFRNSAELSSTRFISNSASNRAGGAYFSVGATLINTDFISNSSTLRGGGAYIGGSATINGGIFQANQCSSSCLGGGLFITSTLTMSGVQFLNNNAGAEGGAIYLDLGNGTIENSAIRQNRATLNGGGVRINGGNLSVTNSDISQNQGGNGAGVYVGSSLTLGAGALISANVAITDGGGIYVATGVTSSLHLNGGSILSNTANGNGGGLFITGTTSIVTFTNGLLADNYAGLHGGGLHRNSGSLVLADGIAIERNQAGQDGGGIYSLLGMEVGQVDFIANRALMGGGLYVAGRTTFSGTDFISNTANVYGGGFYVNNSDGITNSRLLQNSANSQGGGGYLAAAQEELRLNHVQVISNSASSYGGGLAVSQPISTLHLLDSSFVNNQSGALGGGVYLQEMQGALSLQNSPFEGNRSSAPGGGIAVQNGIITSLLLTQSPFLSNTTNSVGGGIYLTVLNGNLSLQESHFESNRATSPGGGIYVGGGTGGSVSLSSSPFLSNTSVSGGGIYLSSAAANVSLTNSEFVNNATTGPGGGLFLSSASALTLTDSSFISNSSTSVGGGIYLSTLTGNLKLSNSPFERNRATSPGGGIYVGGGSGGAVMLDNSSFLSNTSTSSNGGGMYLSSAATDVSLIDSSFVNNVAGGGPGGGIYFGGGSGGAVKLESSPFLSNTSTSNGGGIYLSSAATDVSLIDSTFVNNIASGGPGGALYLSGASALTLTNSPFISNTSSSVGGGISLNTLNGALSLSNSPFERNRAASPGGGIYVGGGSGGSVTLDNSSFLSNTSTSSGGGIYLSSSATDVSLMDSSFVNNITSGGPGGGLYISTLNGRLLIKDSPFERNRATSPGGGIYVGNGNGGSVTLDNSSFLSNTSTSSPGGGIYLSSSATDVSLIDSSFVNNLAGSGPGGGLYLNSASALTLTNSPFVSNTSSSVGGGINLNTLNGVLSLSNSPFERNRAASPGGGIYVGNGSGGSVKLESSPFLSNTSTSSPGGGIYLSSSATDVSLMDSSFVNNVAGGPGGGLYLSSASALTLTNSPFVSNTSSSVGGGINLNTLTGALSLSNSPFERNRATSPGGGIYVGGGSGGSVTLDNSSFLSNTSTSSPGGGIYLSSAATDVSLIDSSLVNNNAAGGPGGGLYLNSASALTLTNSPFISNTSSSVGGGINLNTLTGALSLSNSPFERNRAASPGGGIYVSSGSGGSVTLDNSSFLSNTSTSSPGGGIYLSSTATDVSLIDSSFVNNVAGGGPGGGFYIGILNGSFTAKDSPFERNQAITASGGAIYVNAGTGGEMSLGNSAIQENHADVDGGALWIGANMAITGGQFISNTAGGYGGGVYFNKDGMITNTTFLANGAQQGGGALYLYGGNNAQMRVVNSLFARNYTDNGQGDALYLFNSLSTGGAAEILFSTIASPTLSGGAAIVSGQGVLTITNSIIANHAIAISQTGSSLVSQDYNLFFANTANSAGSVSGGDNSLTGDPAFVNSAIDDYRLSSESAAIDMGVDAGIHTDFFGDMRPMNNGFDIGYDESFFIGDVVIAKWATPTLLTSGATVTYTLAFSNSGTGIARNVFISDSVPLSITLTGITSSTYGSGVTISQTGDAPDFVWSVSDLLPEAGGFITLTGTISDSAAVAGTSFTNTALISASNEITFTNNNASAMVEVKPLLFVQGTLSGLAGSGLVLQNTWQNNAPNNGTDDLALTANGSFTFAMALIDGSSYSVTVLRQPGSPLQNCVVLNGSGQLASLNIDNVEVNCTTYSYLLSTTTAGTGSGTISLSPSGGTYDHGTVVTATANAQIGSTFSGWSGDCSGTGSCVVTMDAAKSVTATFTLNSYALSTTTAGTGSGTISLSPVGGTYDHGTVVTATANAQIGSTLSGWSGDCSGTGSCVVTMDAAKSVTATFTLNSYALSTATEGTGSGTISLSPSGGTYDHGTVVTATANAQIGSTFSGWSGDCSGTDSCVVTMDAAKSVTATFTLNGYTLITATAGTGSGTISLSPVGSTYDHGTVVTATATADVGSVFTGWLRDCSGMTDCTLTMTESKTITASFRLLEVSIEISAQLQNQEPIQSGSTVTLDVTITNTGEITTSIDQINASLAAMTSATAEGLQLNTQSALCVAPVMLSVGAVHECTITLQITGAAGQQISLQVSAAGNSLAGTAVSATTTTLVQLEVPTGDEEEHEPGLDKRLFLPLVAR